MRSKWLSYMAGYVQLELRGGRLEWMMNELLAAGIVYWDARRTSDGSISLKLHVSDFFRLRALLKKTGCRTRLIERYGMPFRLRRLLRRKFFVMGFAAFFGGLYLLSSIVWQIEVTGNDSIHDEDILTAAKKAGVYELQWKDRLKDPDQLSKEIGRSLPNASWVGVEMKGTKVLIKVVESRIPDKRQLLSPRHLTSTSDAVVTQILAENGRPLVKPNMRVKKGDILISGILGDEENQQTVAARGEVRGLVWHEYDIRVPLIQKHKAYTGESKDRFYLTFGSRALKMTGYGASGYRKEETDSSRSVLQWRSWSLPFGWLNETVREVQYLERKLTKEEAKAVGIQQARVDLLGKLGPDTVVREQKLLHESVDNGKVYMKVLFETEEDITTEAPVILESEPENETKPQGD